MPAREGVARIGAVSYAYIVAHSDTICNHICVQIKQAGAEDLPQLIYSINVIYHGIYLRRCLVSRSAKLFRNGRSQAVRLPSEYRFEGTQV